MSLLCETFQLSRAAYYAEADRKQRGPAGEGAAVVRLPARPRHTCAELVLMRIREVLARETARLPQPQAPPSAQSEALFLRPTLIMPAR